jgi:hypothetical protein
MMAFLGWRREWPCGRGLLAWVAVPPGASPRRGWKAWLIAARLLLGGQLSALPGYGRMGRALVETGRTRLEVLLTFAKTAAFFCGFAVLLMGGGAQAAWRLAAGAAGERLAWGYRRRPRDLGRWRPAPGAGRASGTCLGAEALTRLAALGLGRSARWRCSRAASAAFGGALGGIWGCRF